MANVRAHEPRFRTCIRNWIDSHPGYAIVLAGLAGLVLAFCGAPLMLDVICGQVSWGASLCAAIEKNPPWVLLSGLIAAPALLLTWWWRTIRKIDDLRLAKESLVTDRFSKATELLASDSQPARVGGVMSLRRLGLESEAFSALSIESLAAFIREKANSEKSEHHIAVEVALEVIAELRAKAGDAMRSAIDLRQTWLASYRWPREGCFSDFDFAGSSLESADLSRRRFRRAVFRNCDLRGANLDGADLTGADISGAKLQRASFDGADLTDLKVDREHVAAQVIEGDPIAMELRALVEQPPKAPDVESR